MAVAYYSRTDTLEELSIGHSIIGSEHCGSQTRSRGVVEGWSKVSPFSLVRGQADTVGMPLHAAALELALARSTASRFRGAPAGLEPGYLGLG